MSENKRKAREKKMYFKELSHGIMEGGKPNICGTGQQADNQGRNDMVVQIQDVFWQNSFPLEEVSLLFHSGLSLV